MDRLGMMLGIAVETSGDAGALMMLVCGRGLIAVAAGLAAWLWVTRDDG